jgi:uncharacterized protein (TIGR02421 family)
VSVKNAGHERASNPVAQHRQRRPQRGREARTGSDEKLTHAARLLRKAERPLRVLRLLAWPPEVAERFFADGARELPRVRMRPTSSEPALELVSNARTLVRGLHGPAGQWLRRQATAIEGAARMLAVVGTPDFFRWSAALYGAPSKPLWDRRTTSLELARRLDRLLHRLDRGVVPASPPLTAVALAERMRSRVTALFDDATPEVLVVDHLSAKAVAGQKRIRIHGRAPFTEADLAQLFSHEAMIHVATKLNGQAQRDLAVLASGHPGTTRTQEGLAVFSELITGAMTPARFRRLSNRVLAIQMSIDGADFLEVYRFFLDRTDDPAQSFEDARRVFRGGVLTGGAPCTKDNVYLDGLLRVHNFLRVAVELGRIDVVPILFCGRLDLEDVPALVHLRDRGLCHPPRFLPPWAADAGFLVAYLAYSGFLNGIGLPRVRDHYRDLLSH